MIIKRPIGEKGQVVIPKNIRKMLNLRRGEKIVFEVIDKKITLQREQDGEEFLRDFLNVPKPKKNFTLKDLKKIEDESYDLP
jgi:AbrB family looped-hinge helix DNA binding protein